MHSNTTARFRDPAFARQAANSELDRLASLAALSRTTPPAPPDGHHETQGMEMLCMKITKLAAALSFAAAALLAPSRVTAQAAAAQDDTKWGPAPAVFPAGAQMAVLQGDPSSNALFTVRLRFPDNYRIPPHTHPTDEIVTVISGTFRVGMGNAFAAKDMMTLSGGGFVIAPAGHAHFAAAQGTTVVQVHAMGPFAMTYVNPADAPRK